jgi:cytochrome c oxidase assembly factor CtaG
MASLLLAAALLWLVAVGRARAAHGPAAVSRRRTALFLAGIGVLAVALLSPVDAGAATRFSVHMVQHLLLTLVAAPLLVLARPLTLALQAATPATRARLLAALRSWPLAALTAPPLAWCGFALVLWATHFSPLYQAALGNPALHALEHLAYLGTALLFWSAVAAVDPSPARLSPPARILYLLLAMPPDDLPRARHLQRQARALSRLRPDPRRPRRPAPGRCADGRDRHAGGGCRPSPEMTAMSSSASGTQRPNRDATGSA